MGSWRKSTNCDEGFIKQEMFNFRIWGGNNRFHPDTSVKSWEDPNERFWIQEFKRRWRKRLCQVESETNREVDLVPTREEKMRWPGLVTSRP